MTKCQKSFLTLFFIIILTILLNPKYINKYHEENNILYCHNELDPFSVFAKILNTNPNVLCKSRVSEHICYQINFPFYQIRHGVLCFMKNVDINPSYWKEDGHNYSLGPTNFKTKGAPLIFKGFFNMKCNIKKPFNNYNLIYKSYFDSWKYSSYLNYTINNEKIPEVELFPGKTIFLLSRNQDSPNLLIGLCHILNAFSLMHLLNLKPNNIRIIFLESINLTYDPFYNIYKYILLGGVDPIHIRELDRNKIYHISNGIHVPMNWDSPCFCLHSLPNCSYATKTYNFFLNSIFKYLKIPNFVDSNQYNKEIFYYPKSFQKDNLNKYKIYLTFQWRKPWPKNRKKQFRILANGEELVEILDKNLNRYNVLIRLVDTALLKIEEQIAIMQKTDYFLGIHGAGITLGIFLPKNSIIHEIKYKKEPNRPIILGKLTGHKVYSEFMNVSIKLENSRENVYIKGEKLVQSVLKNMEENHYF